MLKSIKILRDRVENWDAYPFSVAAIRSLNEIKLRSKVCLFAGENGTGKSSLLEAIAAHYGFGGEGGNRNFGNDSTETNHSVDPLVRALRLSFDRRTGAGYFLRAESWFNAVSFMDKLDEEPSESPPISTYYGGRSLHTRSHGETFFTLLDLKFRRNGLFLLDEPEAALSPQRQLSFLVLIHDVLQKYKDAQFIISTHSPIILGYPDAQILSFDGGKIHEIEYENTASLQVVRQFVNDRDNFLKELLKEDLPLFETRMRPDHYFCSWSPFCQIPYSTQRLFIAYPRATRSKIFPALDPVRFRQEFAGNGCFGIHLCSLPPATPIYN
jgi:predicted ATPase